MLFTANNLKMASNDGQVFFEDPFLLSRNHVRSHDFSFEKLESNLITISISSVIALGGIWIVFFIDSFDDDDDQDGGGGSMSPVYEPTYVGSPA